MKKRGKLLVVDDNSGVLTAVEILMRNYFEEVRTLARPDLLPATLKTYQPDVLLLDMNFRSNINTGNEGLYWLEEAKRQLPSVRVVLFTAYADVNLAVEGMKRGATDFIVKPFENARLVEVLQNAYAKGHADKPQQQSTQMFWGTSKAMIELKQVVEKVARTDANILITGENGTGKELLAREIHRLSLRSKAPMVAVDMGAVSETLFESELFGHVRGAFTDAKTDHQGKMEAARGGTLFLDEIGNLSYGLQAKMLRALQQRQIVRLGGNEAIPVDIRLICATNRDLRLMVDRGEFRDDLLYRINTIHLHLPSLNERRDDIPALSRMFVDRFVKAYGKPAIELRPDACAMLASRQWQGNIRELEHAIEKAVILSDGNALKPDDFDLTDQPTAPTKPTGDDIEQKTLEDVERQMIKAAVDRCEGNLSLAASQLGISRQTLYNKLKRYGL